MSAQENDKRSTWSVLGGLGTLLGACLLYGCPGALPSVSDCPPPSEVMVSPDLLQEAEVVETPKGCTCDAPIRCALCSSNVGYCSYTFEARCDGCVIDVTWTHGTP